MVPWLSFSSPSGLRETAAVKEAMGKSKIAFAPDMIVLFDDRKFFLKS
jgi:hypothetical protein